MRSLLAGAAAIWFIYNALSYMPQNVVWLNDGATGGLDGDPGAVAVTWAARTLFAGLALISLALLEWDKFAKLIRGTPPAE